MSYIFLCLSIVTFLTQNIQCACLLNDQNKLMFCIKSGQFSPSAQVFLLPIFFFLSRCTLAHSPILSNRCCQRPTLRKSSAYWDISSALDTNSFAFSQPESVPLLSVTSSACPVHFSWHAVSAVCSWRRWGGTSVTPSGNLAWSGRDRKEAAYRYVNQLCKDECGHCCSRILKKHKNRVPSKSKDG